MNQSDHDLLIEIAVGQREMQSDVRAISDALRELKSALDQTNERQRDQDNRIANLTNIVTRIQADQREDHKKVGTVEDLLDRWKIYLRIAVVLMTPVYLAVLALAIEAAKRFLFATP